MYKIVHNEDDSINISIKGLIADGDGELLSNDINLAASAGKKRVICHINSYGGSVRAAYEVVTAFKANKMKVKCINEGFAVSAASVILASADESSAYDYSLAMIHNPLLGGTSLNDTEGADFEFLSKVKDGIVSIYSGRMKTDEDTINRLMDKETSFNSKEQLEIGLVDEIIQTNKKPAIKNGLSNIEIYNIIEEFNSVNNNIKNDIKMVEVINYLKLNPEDSNAEIQVLDIIKENESKIVDLTNKLNDLTVSNFMLVNSKDVEGKEELVKNAVKSYGIDVLDTIKEFIKSNVDNTSNVITDEVKIQIDKIIETSNEVIDQVIEDSVVVEVENKLDLANKIFDFKGDQNERIRIKNEDPKLYNELWDLYTESL